MVILNFYEKNFMKGSKIPTLKIGNWAFNSEEFYDYFAMHNSLKWEKHLQKLSSVKDFIKILIQITFCLHKYGS